MTKGGIILHHFRNITNKGGLVPFIITFYTFKNVGDSLLAAFTITRQQVDGSARVIHIRC